MSIQFSVFSVQFTQNAVQNYKKNSIYANRNND